MVALGVSHQESTSRGMLLGMAATNRFRPSLFRFLTELADNNDRDWFQANKGRYEDEARGPAMEFIAAVAPGLGRTSEHIRADPRPAGGSLFRIHRDVRFSKDKSPYKTHIGIQFRHEAAKNAYAPGYYLHLEPGLVFFGCGIWHPDAKTSKRVRQAIVDDPAGWKRAVHSKKFTSRLSLGGESLKRPPRDFPADHELVEDLMRKDFIADCKLKQGDVTSPGFEKEFLGLCKDGAPLMRFICGALELPF